MKKNLIIDWSLIPAFMLTAVTGIRLHFLGHGHGGGYGLRHDWAVSHILVSLMLTALVTWHIKQHWGWYKSLFRNGPGRKSRITAALSLAFPLLTITGLVLLLNLCGRKCHIGLWHYWMGLAATALAVLHLARRFRFCGSRRSNVFRHKDIRNRKQAI